MKPSDRQSGKLSQDETLEGQLRSLPQPPVPAGLRAKLLAALPDVLPPAKPRRLKYYIWAGGATAAAAVVLLAVSLTNPPPVQPPRPAAPAMTEAEIVRTIEREASAARLLAAAEIIGQYPAGANDALDLRRHIASAYADTSAGKEIGLLGPNGKGDIQ